MGKVQQTRKGLGEYADPLDCDWYRDILMSVAEDFMGKYPRIFRRIGKFEVIGFIKCKKDCWKWHCKLSVPLSRMPQLTLLALDLEREHLKDVAIPQNWSLATSLDGTPRTMYCTLYIPVIKNPNIIASIKEDGSVKIERRSIFN